MHPSLRSAIFRIAVTEGGAEAYEAVKKDYLSTTSIDGKEIALQALGRVQTPDLAAQYLDFIFSPAVAIQDVHSGAMSLAANAKTRYTLWDFVKKNWDMVYKELSGNMVVLDRFLRLTLNKFASFDTEKDIKQFFEGKDVRGFDRALGIVSDTITGNAKFKARDEAVVREWLSARGYL